MKQYKNILICYGTRPEIIKLSPLINILREKKITHSTVFTGQHTDLFDDVKDLIPDPDYKLSIMKKNQTLNDILSRISEGFIEILKNLNPDIVIVQGDTSTVLTCALNAFYANIDIGHVEAGLRTFNLSSPYPEEGNRQLVSRIANYNWAPTKIAFNNLKKEGVKNIFLTGNTIVDACKAFNYKIKYNNKILITLHRRENFGDKIIKIFKEINQLATIHNDLEFIFPMHPNPNIQQHKSLLSKIKVIKPLKYLDLLKLLSEVKFVISDSGGIQEECATFKKKILVCRDNTERPEGVDVGFAKIIGTNVIDNFDWANNNNIWNGINPYGDGKAANQIVKSLGF
tara:strand:- start:8 stop:1033 length:1026 start_codon:yes stop_codon:yes gene_type:complete